jgi:hypothetical protein
MAGTRCMHKLRFHGSDKQAYRSAYCPATSPPRSPLNLSTNNQTLKPLPDAPPARVTSPEKPQAARRTPRARPAEGLVGAFHCREFGVPFKRGAPACSGRFVFAPL